MNLDNVGAVFLRIFLTDRIGRQLAGLAAGNKSGAQFESENGAADETARFDAYHFGDTLVAIELRKIPADDVESTRIFEGSGKILEKDALGGEILDIADFGLDVFH